MVRNFRGIVIISLFGNCFFSSNYSYAASVQAHGQAGLVGEYLNTITPGGPVAQTIRAPLGLTLEAHPTNNFGMFFDLRLGFNQYPYLARDLGNDQEPPTNKRPPLPFNLKGGRGERTESAHVGFGYVEYVSPDIGLFRVGRVPRHWGLGVWRHDGGISPSSSSREWNPSGGSYSLTDGVSAIVDFRTILFGLHWEKNAEGNPLERNDDAEAYTAELIVGESPTDVSQSGVTREAGIAFSRFSDNYTGTNMSILDIYSRLQFGSLLGEGELLYVNGNTQSATYADLGGSAVCPEKTDANKFSTNLMCGKEKIDTMAALVKLKYQISSTGNADTTLSSNEAVSKRGIPTLKRRESHATGLWFGYAGGDPDAFNKGAQGGNSKITMATMHPNIRPSLMIFNSSMPEQSGMPGAIVKNAIFARGEYVYENPAAGTFTPAVIWGMLPSTTSGYFKKVKDAAGNDIDSSEKIGYGRYSDLGVELDLSYSYTTADFIKLGAEAGVWLPGKAWAKEGSSRPTYCLGGRLTLSTIFH